MNRETFRKLSKLRLKEAKVLRDNGNGQGAYYMAGYAVECALKACIAKATSKSDFPPRDASKYYTHDLKELLQLTGIDKRTSFASNTRLEANWSAVIVWSEKSRYEPDITLADAIDLIAAIEDRQDGVLKWLQGFW